MTDSSGYPAWKDIEAGTVYVDSRGDRWELSEATVDGALLRRTATPVDHNADPIRWAGLPDDPCGLTIVDTP